MKTRTVLLKRPRAFLLVLIVFFLQAAVLAQGPGDISGKVLDSLTGSPLPGISVTIKGTRTGTKTNADGSFSLSGVPADAVLVFTSVGLKTREVTVGKRASFTILMENNAVSLDEVVAIGFGTLKKKDLTGSVSSISSEDIQKRGTTSAIEALQGQVAGVNISNKSGRAGGGFDIQIRGLNSLSGSSAPLYVVDGIVTDAEFLNPADIERIDILKDASSTAIYGSRGSNGVVIITTKNSAEVRKEGISISYDGYYGIRSLARTPKFMDGDEWLDWRTDAWMNFSGTDANGNPIYNYGAFGQDPTAYVFVQSPLLMDRFRNKDYTDWFDLTTRTGLQQNHYVKLEGRSKAIKYTLGLGYEGEKGNVPNDEYKKYNINLSAEGQISRSIKLGANFNFANIDRDLGSKYSMASLFSPLSSPYDANGDLQPQPGSTKGLGATGTLSFTNGFNPVMDQQNVTNNELSRFLMANLFLKIDIIKDLSFQSTVSPTYSTSRAGTYEPVLSHSQFTKNVDLATLTTGIGASYTVDNVLTYLKDINNHHITMMVMQNYYKGSSESNYISAEDFPYNSSFYNMNNAKKINAVKSDYTERSLLSYAGRANYSYKGKYYATATVRWDGSSMLANKWASFPSVALAWRLSEESFMRSGALSDLKLRASYGYTGNNNNIGPFETMALANVKTYYDYNGNPANGFVPNGVINRSLTWERTSEIDLAVDYGFFNNRINGSVDLYSKRSKGLLMERKLPVETGWVSMNDNVGSVSNKGIEVSLNTVNIHSDDLHWGTSFTFAKNVNKIIELYGSTTEDDVQNRWFIGQPVRVVYGYVFDGIWTREEKEQAALYGQREGMAKVKDFNATDALHSIDPSDRRILGSPLPSWTGGFATNLSYKNLDLAMNIFTVQGVYVFSPSLAANTDYADRGGQKYSLNFYRPAGTPVLQQDLTFAPGPGNPSQEAPMAYSNNAGEWWHTGKNDPDNEKPGAFTDASYVKVQNITLGYTFNKRLTGKAKIKALRMYVNVRNPFVFTDYIGYDPEWAEASTTGRDAGSYGTITWQLGMNLKF